MLNEKYINEKLKNVPNYLGTFAINELAKLRIRHYPCFLIINMDTRWEAGSHWIGVALYQKYIYLCDSLGIIRYDHIPVELANFLHLYLSGRKMYITCQLQWQHSTTCGFYALFFILYMQTHTFCEFLDSFSRNFMLNDILVELYCKPFQS